MERTPRSSAFKKEGLKTYNAQSLRSYFLVSLVPLVVNLLNARSLTILLTLYLTLMLQKKTVSENEFYMWRAVFAFALVDGMLSLEEQKLLQSYRHNVSFSVKQFETLQQDFQKPQNVLEMYRRISDPALKKRFCVLARALSWCEGDMDGQEQAILKKLDCFKAGPEAKILRQTRNNPYIHTFYQDYARAGVVGLYKGSHNVEIRV